MSRINIYGKIAQYFIDNRKLSFLIVLCVLLWGLISFFIMPKQYNPDIVAPAFQIDVSFLGATADEVYQVVTKPLEDVLNELPGVENIYSTSVHGGLSSTMVSFYVGEDLDKSTIALRQKISSRLILKPLGVSEPCIKSIDPEDLPIKTYAISSDKLDEIQLRYFAYFLKDKLRHVEGVSIIDILGGRKREFKIILDPAKMKNTKTSLTEIENALSDTALLRDLGVIKARENYFHVETYENVETIKNIEDIIIASNSEIQLRIKDVAKVIMENEEIESFAGFYKKGSSFENTLFIAISKQKGANIIDVAKRLDFKIADLKKRYSSSFDDVLIEIVKDDGCVAEDEINGLAINLTQAVGIVFVVLLFFLNYRAASIVAISIPLTLLAVFGFGNLFGYTVNRITLFALILSLGLLVDSATVVVENIVRHKNKFPNANSFAIIPIAVSEVGAGLFLSTLTTIVAFVPMLFVTGMMGPYMGPLPFFVSVALGVSLCYAYTINPWLAYLFCSEEIVPVLHKKCGVLCKISEWILNLYEKFLSYLLKARKNRRLFLFVCFFLLLVVLSFPVLKLVRFRMLPKADREQVFVYIDLNRGRSIEFSQNIAQRVSERLSLEPDVKSVQSFVGMAPVLDFNGLFKGVANRKASHQITLKVNFSHPKERNILSEELAVYSRKIIMQELKSIPEASVKIIEDPPGPPVMSTFYVKIKGSNASLLEKIALDLKDKINRIKEVKDVDVSLLEKHDKFELTIDKKAASVSNVNVDSISHQLETLLNGRTIGIYHSNYAYEQEYISLQYDRTLRDDITDLEGLLIVNENGIHVPLSRLVKIRKVNQEDIILSDNRQQVVYVSAEMGNRSVTYACIDFLKIVNDYSLSGHSVSQKKIGLLSTKYLFDETDEIVVELGGEWELTVKVFRDLGLAMLCAILVIYFLLVAQFKSFRIPLLILATILLAMLGVMPGFAILFYFARVYFSATSMIGIIALSGIVVNNAIVFMEHVMQCSEKFDTLEDSLIDAGLTRVRPILLTSVTTILGSLVIVADPVWSGLAWAIVFGLSLSACLTLIVFPVLVYEFLGQSWFSSLKVSS